MIVFNIITGLASIMSLLISIFVASKVIKINNRIEIDSSRRVGQKVRGDGNIVSAGDVKYD